MLLCRLESALVLSFDGGGNDGDMRLFHADRVQGLSLIDADELAKYRWINLGVAYAFMASLIQVWSAHNGGASRGPSRVHRLLRRSALSLVHSLPLW